MHAVVIVQCVYVRNGRSVKLKGRGFDISTHNQYNKLSMIQSGVIVVIERRGICGRREERIGMAFLQFSKYSGVCGCLFVCVCVSLCCCCCCYCRFAATPID